MVIYHGFEVTLRFIISCKRTRNPTALFIMARKVVIYVATSLDGYIAGPNIVEKPGEDYGYADFVKTIDTAILGRKTYDWVMKNMAAFPHAERTAYVITRTPRPSVGTTHFYTGSLPELVAKLKNEPGKDIFVDGGSEVVYELLKNKLVEEFVVSIIPILLGGGVRLFKEGFAEQQLTLLSSKQFETGLVQIHYKLKEM